jgi:hypothetical protein
MNETLIGLFEIAELANVSPSAVANWRKRFTDFPQSLVELKSGPVFSENQVKLWLAKRQGSDAAMLVNSFMTNSRPNEETFRSFVKRWRR